MGGRLLQTHCIDIDALGGFTCIIGCDLVYHEFAPELLETIDHLLSRSSLAVAYITFPDRCKDSATRFAAKLESMAFIVNELSFVERCTSWDAEKTQSLRNIISGLGRMEDAWRQREWLTKL